MVIIGSGYIGLVFSACQAELGGKVTCMGVDQAKSDSLLACKMPVYESVLDDLVERNVATNHMYLTTTYDPVVSKADLVLIAVGRPIRRGDGHYDLVCVYEASKHLAQHLSEFTVVVDKSTVPIGTVRQVERIQGVWSVTRIT